MKRKYRGVIVLIYLCTCLFLAFFIMSISFSLLGYWVGGGKDIIDFFTTKLITYCKVALTGPLIGVITWFFYYR